jgi:hypothetical protein
MYSCIQFVIIFDVSIDFRIFTFYLFDYEFLGTFQLYIIIICFVIPEYFLLQRVRIFMVFVYVRAI